MMMMIDDFRLGNRQSQGFRLGNQESRGFRLGNQESWFNRKDEFEIEKKKESKKSRLLTIQRCNSKR